MVLSNVNKWLDFNTTYNFLMLMALRQEELREKDGNLFGNRIMKYMMMVLLERRRG